MVLNGVLGRLCSNSLETQCVVGELAFDEWLEKLVVVGELGASGAWGGETNSGSRFGGARLLGTNSGTSCLSVRPGDCLLGLRSGTSKARV